jgi:hypothetical protein
MKKKMPEPEGTVTVRIPRQIYEDARAVSDGTAGHVLGRRSIAEIVVAAVSAGLPIVEKEAARVR